MGAPADHLAQPPAPDQFRLPVRRPRTGIHIDIAPEGESPEFEVHLDLIVPMDGMGDLFENVIRAGLRGVLDQGRQRDDPMMHAIEMLERFRAVAGVAPAGVNLADPPQTPARVEVRFRHAQGLPEGYVECSVCQIGMPEAEAGAHARTHGAGPVREEVVMRPVAPARPNGEGDLGPGPVAERPADDGAASPAAPEARVGPA